MESMIWSGFSMALFAAVVNATKRNQSVADKLLSAWLFLFAFDFGNLGLSSVLTDKNIIPSTFLLFNPAFYLYAKSLTKSDFKLKWLQLIHLLPYLLIELIKNFYKLELDVDAFFKNDSALWFRLAFAIIFISSLIYYNLISILLVHKHRINLKNNFSTIGKNQRITWLLFILVAYIVYVFTISIWGFTGFIVGDFLAATTYNFIASLVLIFTLGFYGINQEEIYIKYIGKKAKEIQPHKEAYKQSNLTVKRKQQIKERLTFYFSNEKPYLNPDLSMFMLSEILEIPKHHITEVLNTEIGKNFFRYVNEFRVQEVKMKLLDPKNSDYSIEAIGYECGFNSKSSFFSVFKLITGLTPLQFQKSI